MNLYANLVLLSMVFVSQEFHILEFVLITIRHVVNTETSHERTAWKMTISISLMAVSSYFINAISIPTIEKNATTEDALNKVSDACEEQSVLGCVPPVMVHL